MKRQQIRKSLIMVSFLLFPVTFYYFSPALILGGAFEGIINGSFIVFGMLFLSSLLLGRAFCGWVCPGAGLQEGCLAVSAKKARGGKANWLKYFLWVPWLSLIVYLFVQAGGIKGVDFFYQTTHGVSLASPEAYPVYYVVIALFIILPLTAGKRAVCHYICWMAPFMILGNRLKNLVNLPSLHLQVTQSGCTGCKACERECPMSLEVNRMVAAAKFTDDECILCGSCVDSCPKGLIKYAFGRNGEMS